ncbi:MAG: ABC transporter ATP-binding protein [Clostridiales bacterium]|nr:ABC transporter ATP-binding protein [Clostridiales bacterium]MCF8021911.1 ABC transporter ATP-binding protein [Clostridiales bacterium]
MNQTLLLEMKQITKRFPGILANDRINFTLHPGEIHMLLGENGSGKSTLMNILSGIYKPDGGEIFIKGRKTIFKSPRDSIKARIGMVHQHFKLIDTFSAAENIVLGTHKNFKLNKNDIEKKVYDLAKENGLEVSPRAKLWQLSVGEKQRVEILKLLYRGAEILVLDEPTAVLTPGESRDLFSNLKKMAREDRGIIVITHKLHEVIEAADRVTVLRSGKSMATLEQKDFSQEYFARLMVGRKDIFSFSENITLEPPGEKILELNNVQALNENGRLSLKDISFNIRKGEIFGVAGIAGNGQRELAETITGLRKCTSGNIHLKGENITNMSPSEINAKDVGHVPEDRVGTGLVPGLDIINNIMLKGYKNSFSRGIFLNYKKAFSKTGEILNEFDIKLGDPSGPVSLLSGGNLQRLLLAREMSSNPALLVAVYPIRGLDVGAIESVHRLLLEQRSNGTAILLISEDLEEILKLSDRIGVLYEGTINGILEKQNADLEKIALLMTRVKNTGEINS